MINSPIFQDIEFEFFTTGPVQNTARNIKYIIHVAIKQNENNYANLKNLIWNFGQLDEYVTPTPYYYTKKACSEYSHCASRERRPICSIIAISRKQVPLRKIISNSETQTDNGRPSIWKKLDVENIIRKIYELNRMTNKGCERDRWTRKYVIMHIIVS